jgi:hypothetical protein
MAWLPWPPRATPNDTLVKELALETDPDNRRLLRAQISEGYRAAMVAVAATALESGSGIGGGRWHQHAYRAAPS